MDGEFLKNYIEENYAVYDRFTFDRLFKVLLLAGYDNEQAKDVILCNCALSLLVMQERIDNEYYLKIKTSDEMAPDLLAMFNEEWMKKSHRWN